MIIILIALGMVACSTPPPADVSERDQPPSRRLYSAAGSSASIQRVQADIPASQEHQVNRRETLYSIAWRYNLDYRQLASRNNIAPPYTIYPSQRLRLDVGTRPAGATTTAQATSPQRPVPRPTPAAAPRSENTTRPVTPAPAVSGAVVWRWPTEGRVIVPFNGNNGLNRGIDIDGKLGQPVIAAAPGQVVYAGSGLRGYGKLLIIKHNDIYLSAYAHNQRLLVTEGDQIRAGQRVAEMGSSGADRVKLHFEIRRNGTPVDPAGYLPRR